MVKRERQQHILDATDMSVGRIASHVAMILMGKNKPEYQPHTDCGDRVLVTNAQKVKFTASKLEQKVFYKHTQYPGGLKRTFLKDLFKKSPELVLKKAVYNMLPKNKLRPLRMKRFSVKN